MLNSWIFQNIILSALLPWRWKQLDPVSVPCVWKPWQQLHQTHICIWTLAPVISQRTVTLLKVDWSSSPCVLHICDASCRILWSFFCPFDLVGLFLILMGRISWIWLPCADYLRTGFCTYFKNKTGLSKFLYGFLCDATKVICNQTLATRASSWGLRLLKMLRASAVQSFHRFYLVSVCVCPVFIRL